MATLAQNSADLAAGLREIAAELGSMSTLYRSSAVTADITGVYSTPIDPQWNKRQLLADFPRDYSYRLAIDPKRAERVAVLDPALVVAGDYIVRNATDETFFVGSLEPFTPIAAVVCNRTLSLRRQSDTNNALNSRVGNVGQIGNVTVGPRANTPFVLIKWPASVLYSGRGSKPLSSLPTNTNAPQWTVLLPVLPIVVNSDDTLVDDLGQRYQVIAAEQNATGVRLICDALEN